MDIKRLMAMNNLTYRQVKLQLSPASHPKERHDTAFCHAIPQASQYSQFFPQGILQSSKHTDPAPSTATSNFGFSSAKTFLAVINSPRKRFLSEATSGPSQNKLRPIWNAIKIPQGHLHTIPTKTVSPMVIHYSQFHPDKTLSVNGALLHCNNGRLDNSHFPFASSNSPLGAGSLTGHLREAALKVVQCEVLEDDSLPQTHLHFDVRRAVFYGNHFYGSASTYIHGVAVLVSKHIPSAPVSIDFAHTEIELVGCVVHLGANKFNIYSLYLLPRHSVTEHDWDFLFDSLPEDAVIGGALIPTTLSGVTIIDRAGAQLANSVSNSRFSLLNMGHNTFMGSYERRSTAIDSTICSSTIAHYFHWGIDTDPLGSDHFPILIHLLPKTLTSLVSLPGYSHLWYSALNYRRTNWDAYTQSLTHLLHEEPTSHASLQCHYDYLEHVVQESITLSTPARTTGSVILRSKCPWWE
ncbi:hypothetical protein PR048_007960 [Dryococelus australis]|uniref:Uncharacterized protein n=1 Tax=Dryococelus australis TaxID=614101 RepID=A0ABQ9HVX2_9NEOP|nr:hypothetical protein PR048_007960 [Dryococelus australis]